MKSLCLSLILIATASPLFAQTVDEQSRHDRSGVSTMLGLDVANKLKNLRLDANGNLFVSIMIDTAGFATNADFTSMSNSTTSMRTDINALSASSVAARSDITALSLSTVAARSDINGLFVSTQTLAGFAAPQSSLAGLAAEVPSKVGLVRYCTDCTVDSLAVSTQTVTASWAEANNKANPVQ